METNDIIESLNMAAISQQPIANTLLHQIADALKERDAAIAALRQIGTAVAPGENITTDFILAQVDEVLKDV